MCVTRLDGGEGLRVVPGRDDDEPMGKGDEHKTPRYTDGSIVKALEERGIGRPSMYAPILKVLAQREYVVKQGAALVPTTQGDGVGISPIISRRRRLRLHRRLGGKTRRNHERTGAVETLLEEWWVPFS